VTGWIVLAAVAAGCATWLLARSGPADAGRASRDILGVGSLAGAVARAMRDRLGAGRGLPVGQLLAALSSELEAGQPINAALLNAAQGLDPPPCPEALRAAECHGDVTAALRRDARAREVRARDAPGLLGLAACWEVAAQSGAGLATAVSRLADGLRASDRAQDQLASEMAAVRSTARMLAALPMLGLLIGHWIGANPLAWLLGAWPGRAVLALGLGLQAAGLLWLHRLVASARADL